MDSTAETSTRMKVLTVALGTAAGVAWSYVQAKARRDQAQAAKPALEASPPKKPEQTSPTVVKPPTETPRQQDAASHTNYETDDAYRKAMELSKELTNEALYGRLNQSWSEPS